MLWLAYGRASAQGPDFWSKTLLDHEKSVLRARADAQIFAVRQVLELDEWVAPAELDVVLGRLVDSRRLDPEAAGLAMDGRARLQWRQGRLEEAAATVVAMGAIRQWWVVGAFDNEGRQGLGAPLPPEELQAMPVDASLRWRGKERGVGYVATDAHPLGYVDLDARLRPNRNACAWLQADWSAGAQERPVDLWIGNAGAVAVYWNGQKVLTDARYRGPTRDRHRLRVVARAGRNRIGIKSCAGEGPWGVYARLTERDSARSAQGQAQRAADVEVSAEPAATFSQDDVLSRLERTAAQTRPSADALYRLAWWMARSHADDPAERRAHDLAWQAVRREGSLPRWELAAELSSERADLMEVHAGLERHRTEPQARLLRAKIVAQGSDPSAAIAPLQAITQERWTQPAHFEAALELGELLEQANLPFSAVDVLTDAHGHAPGSSRIVRRLWALTERTAMREESHRWSERALALRFDDFAVRQHRIAVAAAQGRTDDVQALLADWEGLVAQSPQLQGELAQQYVSLERYEDAARVLERAVALSPDDARAHASLGRLYLRMGRQPLAVTHLEYAVERMPQDASSQRLLAMLGAASARDEAWATPETELLDRAREVPGYPAVILEDRTVQRVFPNGLGSLLHQWAARVNTTEGARRLRTYSIAYDPGAQKAEVLRARIYRGGQTLEATDSFETQLGEPWYRIYYDTRAVVLVFQDLEPGDVLEVRYQLDDLSAQNMFADYFGDLRPLAAEYPIVSLTYTIEHPRARAFYFNESVSHVLQRSDQDVGDLRQTTFHGRDLPALAPDVGAPGVTERAPYLHISTYETWQQVGRWYWGLVSEQLQLDDAMRATVLELTAGAASDQEKVRRIHEWVLDRTRYVGLEFGIHGYKPYRAPLVVRRGFGDCKDKAALLVTLLRAAGVEARMVLLRTRRNGAIAPSPASLAVFDHAIAYVPSLDLYLDGTAEHSGMAELPDMDQGVMVLLVGPDGAELRTTPVAAPEVNARSRAIELNVAEDGSAELRVEQVARGSHAPALREWLQAPETRRNRLEQDFRGAFAGLTIEGDVRVGPLDRNLPVELEFRAHAPRVTVREGDRQRLSGSMLEGLLQRLASQATRSTPLNLGRTERYRETRTIRSARGMRVRFPSAARVSSRFGQLEVSVEGDALVTQWVLAPIQVSAADYPDFRAFIEQVDATIERPVWIERGEP